MSDNKKRDRVGEERINNQGCPMRIVEYNNSSDKEDIIKRVAQIEYNKGNITKSCYDAMLNYEVEITD